jgi:hypothetical protein
MAFPQRKNIQEGEEFIVLGYFITGYFTAYDL